MLKEQTDFDTLGAEALPGGLAEILRTLQPALEPALLNPHVREKRGLREFFARRRKHQDVSA
jgi:hypothetical protein